MLYKDPLEFPVETFPCIWCTGVQLDNVSSSRNVPKYLNRFTFSTSKLELPKIGGHKSFRAAHQYRKVVSVDLKVMIKGRLLT